MLVVLVLLATLATEIAISARMSHNLARGAMDDLLLRTAVEGRVEILKAALRYDGTNGSGYDGEADVWSWHAMERDKQLNSWGERGSTMGALTPDETNATAQYVNTSIELKAWCEDERSKINLRGLMKPEESPVFQHTRDALIRLIDLYREERSDFDLTESDAKDMVDELVEWLQAEADTEENPMPAVKANRGRLQSVADLLRVSGGKWTADRLFETTDPEEEELDEDLSDESAASDDSSPASESGWMPPEKIPGLARYLTVFAEDAADPPMRINVNTAPAVVLKALFDANDEDLADAIVEYRRQGADEEEETTGTTTGGSADATQGFFKTKQDLAKVDGVGEDLARYPRLNFFADVSSNVYSLRVQAMALAGSDAASDEDVDDGTDGAPKEVEAAYDLVQVVQRTNQGFVTLYLESSSGGR